MLAAGLDPKISPIGKFVSLQPVTCRYGENVEKCERAMKEHKLRRIPIVDGEGRCIGIVSLADFAIREKPERVSRIVARDFETWVAKASGSLSRNRADLREIACVRPS